MKKVFRNGEYEDSSGTGIAVLIVVAYGIVITVLLLGLGGYNRHERRVELAPLSTVGQELGMAYVTIGVAEGRPVYRFVEKTADGGNRLRVATYECHIYKDVPIGQTPYRIWRFAPFGGDNGCDMGFDFHVPKGSTVR